MKKYRYILGLLLAVLWACSNGELEGDLYPVALDKGGKEDNSSMEAVVKGIKENMIYNRMKLWRMNIRHVTPVSGISGFAAMK